MTDPTGEELPVTGATLNAHQSLATAVRGLGRTYGVDYLDDRVVRKMLATHRASLRRTSRGPAVWFASLALMAGIVWLLWAIKAIADRPVALVGLVAPCVLLVAAVAGLVGVYRQGMRKLNHPQLEGYRQVLATAAAHGAPVAPAPDWLTPTRPGKRAREEEEEEEDGGGWHDEVGWLLILGGCFGVWDAHHRGQPLEYAAGLLVVLGVGVLIAGYRRGRGK